MNIINLKDFGYNNDMFLPTHNILYLTMDYGFENKMSLVEEYFVIIGIHDGSKINLHPKHGDLEIYKGNSERLLKDSKYRSEFAQKSRECAYSLLASLKDVCFHD